MKPTTTIPLIAAVLGVCLSLAKAEPTTTPDYTKADIKKMIREAHTQDEYRTLADYFRTQQSRLEEKAAAEKQEWERRSKNVTSPAAKYPRPVDSSRNRYEYFSYEASQMAQQAQHFDKLASK